MNNEQKIFIDNQTSAELIIPHGTLYGIHKTTIKPGEKASITVKLHSQYHTPLGVHSHELGSLNISLSSSSRISDNGVICVFGDKLSAERAPNNSTAFIVREKK